LVEPQVADDKQIARGVAWQALAIWGSQFVSFASYAVLARLLSPRAFGLVAMAWVYVSLIQIFVRQGLGDAIVQRKDLQRDHLSSTFWIVCLISSGFCFLSIVLSVPVARFFKEPQIASVIAWLSLFFPLNALSAVPTALLIRHLNFRAIAMSSLVGVSGGSAIGFVMALTGWGVWSLVAQQLSGAFLSCAILWLLVPWRPAFRFSDRHMRDLTGFSVGIAANDLLWFVSQRSDQTVVGHSFGSLSLGPYSLASRIVTVIYDGLSGLLQSVAFPVFSKIQDEPHKLERAVHRYCELSSFVALPIFGGIAVIAPELIPILFGTRWLAAIPLLQVLAAYGGIRVILGFVHPTMLSTGHTKLNFFMSLVLALLTLAGCLVGARLSPQAVAESMAVTLATFGIFQLIFISRRVLRGSALQLTKQFAFPTFATLLMMAVVSEFRHLLRRIVNAPILLSSCVLVGFVTYVTAALWIRADLVRSLWVMITHVVRRETPDAIPLNPLKTPAEEPETKVAIG
jgi:PST family polysaccharide transporter